MLQPAHLHLEHSSLHALFVLFRALPFCHCEHFFRVIPSQSEESSAWMLHCARAPFSMTKLKVSFQELAEVSKHVSNRFHENVKLLLLNEVC